MALTKIKGSIVGEDIQNALDYMEVNALVVDPTLDNTGATDVTTKVQAILDLAGSYSAVNADGFGSISSNGVRVVFPPGEYLIRDTLYMSSNCIWSGYGNGTQFVFDPTSPNTDFCQAKLNTTPVDVLNQSNTSMRFRDFYVRVKKTGGTITGYGGSGTFPAVNSNSQHCFNIFNSFMVFFDGVLVTDFHYGTAFIVTDASNKFSFYNTITNCHTRDCKQDYYVFSATRIQNCTAGESTAFPADGLSKEYMINIAGRGCSMVGSTAEGRPTLALIKDSGSGTAIIGNYMEHFTGVAAIDASSIANNVANSIYGGNSYGFTAHTLFDESVDRSAAGSDVFILGKAFGFGDCQEIEIVRATTGQSPSFKYGLPGFGHFPAGGTTSVSHLSFVDDTAIVLTRGAGTATTANQITYQFVVRKSNKVTQNIWVSVLVKTEGGEDDFTLGMITPPQNTNFKKVITYNNGWQLWATYLTPSGGDTYTFKAVQNAGSADTSRKLYITGLRAYTNGIAPMPAPYKWPEYRTASPTGGFWVRGDVVHNAQPSASGTPGWVCVFRFDTTLTATEPASETSIAVTAGTGTANGDVIGVVLDTGDIHWTTISSGGGTTTIVLTDALPSQAASGNKVYTYRFKAMASLAA